MPACDRFGNPIHHCRNCGGRVFRSSLGKWLHWPKWFGAVCPRECPGKVAEPAGV